MSLLRYLKKKPLPTAEQTVIGERDTTSANFEVEEVLDRATGNRKRKHYATYTDGDRAEIGKFAAENGKDFQELKSKNKIANTFIIVILINIANIKSRKRNRIYDNVMRFVLVSELWLVFHPISYYHTRITYYQPHLPHQQILVGSLQMILLYEDNCVGLLQLLRRPPHPTGISNNWPSIQTPPAITVSIVVKINNG